MDTDESRVSQDYRAIEEAQKDLFTHEDEANAVTPPQFPFVVKNLHVRECLAEFLSTFICVAFGLGVNAQVVLSKAAAGDYLSVTIGWGIGVMLAMHVGGSVSFSHINPAITLTLAVYGVLPWKKVPGYVIAQVLGAFVASLMIYAMYYQILHVADPTKTTTGVIFYTHPNQYVNHGSAFLTEFCATAVLLCCLLALSDEKNRPTVVPSFPSCVGILVVGIGMAFSLISSAALNPARDFGPRLMLAIVGYDGVFSANGHYFWIPIVAPIAGGIAGAAVYILLILAHHPAKVGPQRFF
ncbi:Aquaporin, partial [Globisporangium splendens]